MATKQIGARLPVELVAMLDEAGERELRDRSNLMEYVLTTWLRESHPDLFDKMKTLKTPPDAPEPYRDELDGRK